MFWGAKSPPIASMASFIGGKSGGRHGYDLPSLVIAARRAHAMRADAGAALGALRQQRRLGTVRCLASAQAHFRHSTFRDTHDKISPLLQFQVQIVQRMPPQIPPGLRATARTLVQILATMRAQ